MSLFARGSWTASLDALRAAGLRRAARPTDSGVLTRGDHVMDAQGRVGRFIGATPDGELVIWWRPIDSPAEAARYAEAVAGFAREHNPWPLVKNG